jgi:two-component system, sensor histidine kinase and response regulator
MSVKILAIDDDITVLDLLKVMLKSEGYDVKTTQTGEAGLELVKSWLPDVIILDIMMPKMSGYMVAALLAKEENLKNIPILQLTATSKLVGSISLETPSPYRIQKPFEPEELIQMLRMIIHEKNK